MPWLGAATMGGSNFGAALGVPGLGPHRPQRPLPAWRASCFRTPERVFDAWTNADVLKRFDFLRISIQGHADERGSVEYNLALGERRARAAYDYLVSLGVAPDRLKTVSYGKEIPLCTDSNETCWARNRRDHFEVTGKTQGSRQR